MAAAWRGAWRWMASSADQGGGAGFGDSLQPTRHPNQRQSRSDEVVGSYLGSSSATGTYTTTPSITTRSSTRSSTWNPALFLHPDIFMPIPPVVEEKAEEQELDQGRSKLLEEERVKTRDHIKVLVNEFSGGDTSGLDRWLSELCVGWVLHLDASTRRINVSQRLQYFAEGWILAVYVISRSMSSFNGWCCPQDQEEEATVWPPASEFVRFFEATLLKMIPFVGTIATLNINYPTTEHPTSSCSGGAVPPAHKLQALVGVRHALSMVSEGVQLWGSWLYSSADAEADAWSIGEMSSILFAELGKLNDAIWVTGSYMANRIMSLTEEEEEDDDDDPSRSPDIHKAARSVVSYINVLSTSYSGSAQLKNISHLTNNLIIDMIHSLEEKIARKSLSFQDQSLKFLFLINNSYFMRQQLHKNRLLDVPMRALTLKIDDYINSYIQVSWTPVVKCLHSRTPCCFATYSPLHRFQSKFQKTYTTQKLRKVPDPNLRKMLREAIIKEVISGITKFLEDNSFKTLEVSPEKLEEMLEELFEG